MKFNVLTRHFSLKEGGHNGTSRLDSAVPYCPARYSLPVQGPGPALLPAHPALLEARQLALDKQEAIARDRKRHTPPSQGISLSEATTEEIHQTPFTLRSISECPTPVRSTRVGSKLLPRDISNLDLSTALETYLNYLSLVGDEQEQEVECQPPLVIEIMESYKRSIKLQEGTTPSNGPASSPVPSMYPIQANHTLLSTSEEFLRGPAIKKIQSLQEMRGKGLQAVSQDLRITLQEGMTIPSIPPRNPAGLPRRHTPKEEALAASYRLQRRQNKRETLAAGFNSGCLGELSSRVPEQQPAVGNSFDGRSQVQSNVGRDKTQIMNGLAKGEQDGGNENNSYQTVGLGIRVEKQACFHQSINDSKQAKCNASYGSGGNRLTSAIPSGGIGSRSVEVNTGKSQSNNIGLGINVYGVCEPFGHGDEVGGQVHREDAELPDIQPEDVGALVEVLEAAWKISPNSRALEMGLMMLAQSPNPTDDAGMAAGVQSAGVFEGTQPVTTVVETAADGSKESEVPVISQSISGEITFVKSSDTHIVAETDAVVCDRKDGATLLVSGAGRDAVPMPAPLSVAAGVAVPRKVAASASSSQPPTASLNSNTDLLDEINNLLEANYRGQAESFNRKISGASAARSFSTHSGAPVTSLRAASKSTAPTSNDNDTPSRLIDGPAHRICDSRTPSTPNQILIHSFAVRHGIDTELQRSASIKQGPPPPSPHVTYGHHFYTVADHSQHLAVGESRIQATCLPEPARRGVFYFSDVEREYIRLLVHSEPRGCEKHSNCIECYNTEYAYFENKVMPTTMPPEERNRVISNNRSLRNIKNELEALAETGAISDEQFDTIMNALPAESSLGGGGGAGGARAAQASGPAPPTAALNGLNLGNSASPPAYTSAPPSLPERNNPPKPEIARATALYRYAEAGDCNFEVGDEIAVYEYMNADWWLGRNLRTGQEGVFPVNYVQSQANAAQAQNAYGNEKSSATGYGGGYPPQQQQYQPPPHAGPSDPYNSAVPPMQIAQGQPEENKPNKGAEAGKKFGKKLGNAAIFGAGASIGSNIVNSIF